MSDWVALVSGPLGALAAVVLFLYGFRQGWWCTSAERDAWKDRSQRAEEKVDTLLPITEKLVDRVEEIARVQGALHADTQWLARTLGAQKTRSGLSSKDPSTR